MAEHTWDVTPQELIELRIGSTTLTSSTQLILAELIEQAAATVNEHLVRFTGQTPESVAVDAVADDTSSAARVRRMLRSAILDEAAGQWLRPRDLDQSVELLDRAEIRRRDLRYSLPAARSQLAPEAGPDPPAGRTERPTSWLSVYPDKDAFG